jgi:hypothetical protein
MEMVRKYQGTNILEIGNVLSNHVRFEHDVLDKYEFVKGIINEDVVDFRPEKRYDLIVSISTLDYSSIGIQFCFGQTIERWDNTVLETIQSSTNF